MIHTVLGKNSLGRKALFKRSLKHLSHRMFFALDQVGIHLLPKHYYTPVADYSWLRKNRDAWMSRANLSGVHWELEDQLHWLQEICGPYYHEVEGLRLYQELESSGFGPGYGPIESQVLHCFVRHYAPANVVEIGSGVSTACMLQASYINKQEGRQGSKIVSVEPFPKQKLREQEGITHVEEMCQKVPESVFDDLDAGDVLFVDSTHTVKLSSELQRIYLDIIPNLRRGVFVHIHDIYLPYLYNRDVLSSYFDWQETSLALALLKNNAHLSVLCCQSALHYDRTKEMTMLLSDYRPQADVEGLRADKSRESHFPSSLWLITT